MAFIGNIPNTIGPQGPTGPTGPQGAQGASGSSTQINATDDLSTAADHYPVFVAATGSNQTVEASTTKLYFRPSTGQLTATLVNTLSDERSKYNIETISFALEKVLQMRGVSFTFKDSNIKSIGVIAQEIEKILPDIVSTNKDGTKSVSYNSIIGLLIEAIKEQQTQINELNRIINN